MLQVINSKKISMSTKEKYSSLLKFGEDLGMRNASAEEKDGKLLVKGMVNTPYEKNVFWDKLKAIGGENASDINADITVADSSIYHIHTVSKGETLGAIAKLYYKDASKYKKIFEANTDKLKDPNLIKPGQQLVIPNI